MTERVLFVKICVDDLCRLFAHAGGIFQLVRRGFLHRTHAFELGHQRLGRFGADAGDFRQGGGITLLLHLLLAVGVGKRYYLSQNIPENEIEGYLEHTMSLSHEFALGGCRLLLQAEIINLTDEQYDVIKYYPMPGRSWRLTGTFKF